MEDQESLTIRAARLHGEPESSLWDVTCKSGIISKIAPHSEQSLNTDSCIESDGGLLLPSLCHAHIHLDKCFVLQDPKFSDLVIKHGDFNEAMSVTGEAKGRFDHQDLMRRGRRLILESLVAGVTMMRAFVEVDEIVGLQCLNAALTLRQEFASSCDIQICAFAQLALWQKDQNASERRRLLVEALKIEDVEAVGSTPYVEDSEETARNNAEWIVEQAVLHNKHLDFHLDYHLNDAQQPLIWHVLEILIDIWPEASEKTVIVGHCTRIACFEIAGWQRLREIIAEYKLLITFVGLPTSDLFMMDRPSDDSKSATDRRRATLQIPHMIKQHELQGAIAINNVGNAFTPHSNCDPLRLASLGMLVYQTATVDGCNLLYECVSTRARKALGASAATLRLREDQPADLILFQSRHNSSQKHLCSASDVVYDPERTRIIFHRGRKVALD